MHLFTLGQFRADGATPESRVLPAGKPLALLLFLALAPKRRASRSALMALIWDEPDERKLSNNFRQALHQLRKALPDAVQAGAAGTETLELNIAIGIDALHFERAVAAGDLEAAWAQYDGHFLADFAAATEFDRWADGVRIRLREQWLRTGERIIEDRLARNDAAGAIVIARRLRDDAPDRQVYWRLLIQSLLTEGQVVRAAGEADALRHTLAIDEEPAERETTALLQRLHSATAPSRQVEEHVPRRAETVGREQPLSRILRAWTQASSGRGSLLLLRAAAGLGKTRMLEDAGARLKLRGATVISVRARPADRQLPNALAANLAESLAAARGAAGLSAASAAVLIGLAPTLSNRYPAAQGGAANSTGGTPELARTLALAELIDVLAEEAPLAILIDDLHYADADSHALIERLGDRLSQRRVLCIAATRPGQEALAAYGDAVIELKPLVAEEIRALLASLAIDEHDLLSRLATTAHQATDGIPLLVLAATELLLERGLLHITDGVWSCTSIEATCEALRGGRILEQLLRDVPPAAFQLLAAVAAAGAELPEPVLAALGHEATSALLADLAQRGLLQRTAHGWETAHDRIADATLATVERRELQVVRRTTGLALLALREPDATHLRNAARLLGDDDFADTRRAFRRWLEMTGDERAWRRPDVAARTFLGTDASLALATRLGEDVGWELRLRRGQPVLFRVGVAAALLLAAILGGSLLSPFLQPAATRIVIDPIPNDNAFLLDRSSGCQNAPATCRSNRLTLQATFRDADNRLSSRAPKTVTARLLSDRPMRIKGDTIARVINGRADFGELELLDSGEFRVELRAGNLPIATTDTMYAMASSIGFVRLTGGSINGQPLSSTTRVVRVQPGEVLSGTVGFDILTTYVSAGILLGAVPTWGDRTSNFFPMTSLPSHGRLRRMLRLENAFSPSRQLRAPTARGRYRIVFLMAAETEMKYIASGTHWARGEALWNDGNDAVDWPVAQLDSLDNVGRIGVDRFEPESSVSDIYRIDVDRRWSMVETETWGTTVTIIVGAPIDAASRVPSAANPRPVPQQNPTAMRR